MLIDLLKTVAGPDGKQGQQVSIRGTGFLVSPDGLIATAAHVIKEIPEGEVHLLGVGFKGKPDENGIRAYTRVKVSVYKVDSENDVALLKIDNSSNIKYPISLESLLGKTEKLYEGDDILMIGYPLATEMLSMGFGITESSYSAIVSTMKRKADNGALHFFLINTHLNKGASGSPVFDLKSGSIVGIATGTIQSKTQIEKDKIIEVPSNIGLCRPINYLANLLK